MLAKKGLMTSPSAVALYVEDVFSTYLYTGNDTARSITNGIDLSGEGGLVWIKSRSNTFSHRLTDTVRGATKSLLSNTTGAETTETTALTAFNADGFSIGINGSVNDNTTTFASWTFRKAKKFFDIVTYTGNGTAGRTISHNLGSVPGCIIIKRTSDESGWAVYHRSLNVANNESFQLNSNIAAFTTEQYWNYTAPTSTEITLGNNATVNGNGSSYVAYIFAHDAGGFGEDGDQSVIKCGSYTGNGSTTGPTIDLGWEPQWVLIKNKSATARWTITDNMRGFPVGSSGQNILQPHVSDAEVGVMYIQPTSTGFKVVDVDADVNTNGNTYIYIAIRRGPMKTPEAGTEVYNGIVRTGTAAAASVTSIGFAPDLVIGKARTKTYSPSFIFTDKLRGYNAQLASTSTAAESTNTTGITGWLNNGYTVGADGSLGGYNLSTDSNDYIHWPFRRAPGFFDVVCYTGTGSAGLNVTHNLGVVPEMMIVKRRSAAEDWGVYHSALGNTKGIYLNYNLAADTQTIFWNNTSPTATQFTLGSWIALNTSGGTHVAYLFASCPGVSKVGSYTGNGSSVTVTTGFQPRFILVKRTDSTGNWIVSDSARGLIAGNDPYLLLNSTAAEDTDEDWVDISSTGFTVNQVTASNANVNTGTYIYLAIA